MFFRCFKGLLLIVWGGGGCAPIKFFPSIFIIHFPPAANSKNWLIFLAPPRFFLPPPLMLLNLICLHITFLPFPPFNLFFDPYLWQFWAFNDFGRFFGFLKVFSQSCGGSSAPMQPPECASDLMAVSIICPHSFTSDTTTCHKLRYTVLFTHKKVQKRFNRAYNVCLKILDPFHIISYLFYLV